jgi:hypothetical protein
MHEGSVRREMGEGEGGVVASAQLCCWRIVMLRCGGGVLSVDALTKVYYQNDVQEGACPLLPWESGHPRDGQGSSPTPLGPCN